MIAPLDEQAEAQIRRVWHEGRWFFSVIDVIGLLTMTEQSFCVVPQSGTP
jgi:hypothetical protein